MEDAFSHPRDTQAPFRLRGLRVDPSTGFIEGKEGSAHLEPRVIAVLLALARRSGTLVTRQALLAEIWPGGDVYDEALTQCVYQLRQQLVSAGGDSCRDLVTTIPKRGYLLNGEVTPLGPAAAEAGAPPVFPRVRVFGAALVVVLSALVFGFLRGWWSSPPAPGPSVHTIAVLPFLPLTETERDPVLELGMADTLITRLGTNRQIIVRPVSSVRRFAELDRDALRAGQDLRADSVVDGSIQRQENRVRVTVRLLRVADGAALWTATFDEAFSGIFELQDTICDQVASALAVKLAARDQRDMERSGTADTRAYELYLQGRFHLARLTPRDLLTSVDYFREAVQRDPAYAQAWLALANVLFRIPVAGEVPPREYYPEARRAVQRALDIDPDLAEGHAILGWIAQWYDWDWAASEAHFKHALELNPNDTESHLGYAHLLDVTSRNEQALTEVRRARELSPFYMVAAFLEGGMLLKAGHQKEALERLQDAVHLDEAFWMTRLVLAGALTAEGRPDEGLAQVRRAYQLSGSTWARAIEISLLARTGRKEEAEALLDELVARSQERYVPPYDLAVAHRALGHEDGAIAWLRRAYELRDPKMVFLSSYNAWKPLRDRPEFAELLRLMNFPDPPLVGAPQPPANPWVIRAREVEWSSEGSLDAVVQGRFEVAGPAGEIASGAGSVHGGGCLVADLTPFGMGQTSCHTHADCNAGDPFDLEHHPERDGFIGYCAARDESGEAPRCWTRPGPPATHCKRSKDFGPLGAGWHALGPVEADPLRRGRPWPEWAIITCLAQPGHDQACGEAGSPYRRFSLGPAASPAGN